MTVVLRDYQHKAAGALQTGYHRGLHRLGIQLPTGTGKTVVMADITKKTLASGNQVNIVLHRDTLFDQTIRKLLAAGVDPDDIGVIKARRNEIHKPCRVVSIHTLRSEERMLLLPIPNLTIIDEAHVSVSETYRRLYERIGAYPGGSAYLAGFTATWIRSDNRGLGDVWEEIVFKRTIAWAVKQGYLVQPHAIQLGGEFDISKVRTSADGDYSEKDLEQLVMIEDLRETVVKAYHTVTPGKSMALFAPTQAAARYFADALRESGVPVAEVFASTKPNDRKWAFHGFETGAIKILASCSALAEGWDSPRCDGVMMLRRTKFSGRFIQEIGRALRPWVGKDRAWLLDFVGTLDEQDMRSVIDLSKTPEREEEELPLDECDECGNIRILRLIRAGRGGLSVDEMLCEDCIRKLDLVPEPREHTAKKIDGMIEIDLFERTTARWLHTDFGMPFITTSPNSKSGIARIFFIVPIDGAYNAGVNGSIKQIKDGYWLAKGVTATEAMDIASEAALDDDPTVTHKNAAWRKDARPTENQINYARSLGIKPEGMTKSQLADEIDIALASRVLGSVYRKMYLDMREGVAV